MENESKFKEWLNSASEFLNEQVWYQEIKTKWEEVDPQSRTYLKFAAFGSSVLLVLMILLSSLWSVYSLKSELRDKKNLLALVQVGTEELRRLKESGIAAPSSAAESSVGWSPYFETVAGTAGVEKASLAVQNEKAGASSDQSKEVLFDLELKHVSVKQVVRFAFMLENGQRPVKLRNLMMDTRADPSGYMDATLAVSAFTLVTQK